MARPIASVWPVDSFSISDQVSFLLYTSAIGSSQSSGKWKRKMTIELMSIGLTTIRFHCPSKKYSNSRDFLKDRNSCILDAYGIFLNLLCFKRKPDIVINYINKTIIN